jgi:hypothetical protein
MLVFKRRSPTLHIQYLLQVNIKELGGLSLNPMGGIEQGEDGDDQ